MVTKDKRSILADSCPTYCSIMRRKENGEHLGVNDLTVSILETLWFDEFRSDAEIAQLFNTSASSVKEFRTILGFTHKACIKKYAQKAAEILGATGATIMAIN